MHLGFNISVFFPFFLGNSEDHLVPMLVSGLRGYHVIDVACGSGDAHSLAVADDGTNLFTLVSPPFYSKIIQYTVNSRYSGHPRDRELVFWCP